MTSNDTQVFFRIDNPIRLQALYIHPVGTSHVACGYVVGFKNQDTYTIVCLSSYNNPPCRGVSLYRHEVLDGCHDSIHRIIPPRSFVRSDKVIFLFPVWLHTPSLYYDIRGFSRCSLLTLLYPYSFLTLENHPLSPLAINLAKHLSANFRYTSIHRLLPKSLRIALKPTTVYTAGF